MQLNLKSPESSTKVQSTLLLDSPYRQFSDTQDNKFPSVKSLVRAKSIETSENKLFAVKKGRKELEEEIKLLQNRLKLLKIEDERTDKNIQETQKKADFIKSLQERTKEKKKMKDLLLSKKEEYVQNQKTAIALRKQERQMKLQRQQEMQAQKHSKAQEIKEISKHIKETIEKSRLNVFQYNSKVAILHQQQKELRNTRKNQWIQIQEKSKRDYLQRVEQEQNEMQKNQELLKQLEQQELLMIESLKSKQQEQMSAFKDLESVILQSTTHKSKAL